MRLRKRIEALETKIRRPETIVVLYPGDPQPEETEGLLLIRVTYQEPEDQEKARNEQ